MPQGIDPITPQSRSGIDVLLTTRRRIVIHESNDSTRPGWIGGDMYDTNALDNVLPMHDRVIHEHKLHVDIQCHVN